MRDSGWPRLDHTLLWNQLEGIGDLGTFTFISVNSSVARFTRIICSERRMAVAQCSPYGDSHVLSDIFWGDFKKCLFTPDREPVPDYYIAIFSEASQYTESS